MNKDANESIKRPRTDEKAKEFEGNENVELTDKEMREVAGGRVR